MDQLKEFRLTFEIRGPVFIELDDRKRGDAGNALLRFHGLPSARMEAVRVGSGPGVNSCSVVGGGYGTDTEAVYAAETWKAALISTFAGIGVSADFGEDGPNSWVSPALLGEFRRITGHDFKAHSLGISIHDDGSDFWTVGGSSTAGSLYLTVAESRWRACLEAFAEDEPTRATERILLAYSLYSGADGVGDNPYARLVLLVSAVEALAERHDKGNEWTAELRRATEILKRAQIESRVKQRVFTVLAEVGFESLGEACQQLAGTVD